MVIVAYVILLIIYAVAYGKAVRGGFSTVSRNAVVLSSGALLLLFPLGVWWTWHLLTNDWPMNIGSKPNFTWQVNRPSDAFRFSAIVYATGTVMTLVFLSLVHAILRISAVHRRSRAAEAEP